MNEPDHHAQKAQAHWDAWQRDYDVRSQQKGVVHYTDWAGHPLIWNKLCEAAFGSASTDVFDYIFQHYPELANAHGLSLCCGDGSFERAQRTHHRSKDSTHERSQALDSAERYSQKHPLMHCQRRPRKAYSK